MAAVAAPKAPCKCQRPKPLELLVSCSLLPGPAASFDAQVCERVAGVHGTPGLGLWRSWLRDRNCLEPQTARLSADFGTCDLALRCLCCIADIRAQLAFGSLPKSHGTSLRSADLPAIARPALRRAQGAPAGATALLAGSDYIQGAPAAEQRPAEQWGRAGSGGAAGGRRQRQQAEECQEVAH